LHSIPGEDGLDLIREIAALAPILIRPGGKLFLEHADSQSDQICQLLLAQGANEVFAHLDLTERLRFVSASW